MAMLGTFKRVFVKQIRFYAKHKSTQHPYGK